MNTADYIDAIRTVLKPGKKRVTDVDVALALGVTKQAVGRYQKNLNHFDEDVSERVAALLKKDILAVLADMEYQRSKCPAAKKAWKSLAKQLGRAAMVVVPLIVVGNHADASTISPAIPALTGGSEPCILCKIMEKVRRWISALSLIVRPICQVTVPAV